MASINQTLNKADHKFYPKIIILIPCIKESSFCVSTKLQCTANEAKNVP